MRPEFVIFDMDDVLCRYDLGRRLRALSRLTGKRPRDIRAAVWDSGFEDDADSGGYPDAAHYLAEFSRRIGHPLTEADWIAARREAMLPNHEVLGLAKTIAAQVPVAIYTNNGPIVKQSLKDLFPEAAAIFGQCYCSYEFATKKPDPMSYRRLLQHLNVDAARTWFIDDKKSNVEGARIAGLAGHHFRSAPRLIAEARDRGLA